MENKIRCSVVMTVYNAEKYLRDAIESVLRQTEKNFELIARAGDAHRSVGQKRYTGG